MSSVYDREKTNLCNSISGLIVSSAFSRMWFNFNFIIFNWSQNYFLLLISKIKFWNWIRTRIKRTWTGVWYPLVSNWWNVFLFTIVIMFCLFWIVKCSVKIGSDSRSRFRVKIRSFSFSLAFLFWFPSIFIIIIN